MQFTVDSVCLHGGMLFVSWSVGSDKTALRLLLDLVKQPHCLNIRLALCLPMMACCSAFDDTLIFLIYRQGVCV